MVYFSLIVLLVLGLIMLLRPEWLWAFLHDKSGKVAEPTESYMAFMRIGGVICLIMAFIIALTLIL